MEGGRRKGEQNERGKEEGREEGRRKGDTEWIQMDTEEKMGS